MSATTPTTEPDQITAGSTLAWTKTVDDYSAADGWTLKYRFLSATAGQNFSITSTADGSDHAVSVGKATTAGYNAGTYTWISYVENADASIRKDVARGTVQILPDPTDGAAYDGRTHAAKMLDLLEATLEGRASASEMEAEIDGRRVAYMSHTDLINARAKYRAEVRKEQEADRLSKGKGTGRRILTRFVTPT